MLRDARRRAPLDEAGRCCKQRTASAEERAGYGAKKNDQTLVLGDEACLEYLYVPASPLYPCPGVARQGGATRLDPGRRQPGVGRRAVRRARAVRQDRRRAVRQAADRAARIE